MEVYIFFVDDGWYPLEIAADVVARAHAELNEGVRRVETADGRVVWEAAKPH